MKLMHIVAVAENGVIGAGGALPWHIKQDLQFFKSTTMGHVLIMGRKTWDSIGRPLPGRKMIVITRQASFKPPAGVEVANSIEDAVTIAKSLEAAHGEEVFVIGGGEIYEKTLPIVDKVYLTMIHKSYPGDTFYPFMLPLPGMKETKREDHFQNNPPFSFLEFERQATP